MKKSLKFAKNVQFILFFAQFYPQTAVLPLWAECSDTSNEFRDILTETANTQTIYKNYQIHQVDSNDGAMALAPPAPKNPSFLEEFMTCPICHELIEGEIRVCMSGHMACSKCWVQLDKCAECRANSSNLVKVAHFDTVIIEK